MDRLTKPFKFILVTLIAVMLFSIPALAATQKSTVFMVPDYDGFKSYERGILENGDYIFTKGTKQYKLQTMAKSTKTGFRRVDGRYLVAVGSRFTENIGQYITLVLKNGKKIPCIVGDLKADKDTDKTHTFTENGCCSEFIVDIRRLNTNLKDGGDISDYKNSWDSPVSVIIVHDQNVFTN